MNVFCIDCGKSFSIGAAQLGTCGRCPHCKSVVTMPASVDQIQDQQTRTVADPRYVQRAALAAVVVLLHVGALIVMAKLPWYTRDPQPSEVEHQFILSRPRAPRLAQRSVLRLQPTPIQSLGALSASTHLTVLPSAARRIEFDNDWGRPRVIDGAFEDLPPFVARAGGGMTKWEQFQRTAQSFRPSETFDQLLQGVNKVGLDVAIVFDSTASMDREIAAVKDGIERIGKTLFRLVPKTRISICTYRDQGDAYVTKGVGLSQSLAQLSTFLTEVSAQGGGDKSESVTAGLRWVLENNRFRRNAKKVILIFGDAPPKPDQMIVCQNLVSDFRFRQRGTVSTVTCQHRRKMEAFQAIAELGGGESFLNHDETQIVQQLLVLVFGSRYKNDVRLNLTAEH